MKAKRSRAVPPDMSDPRCVSIVQMRGIGATLQEIGDELGVTRERVRQIINRIERHHGTVVLGDRIRTASVVARELEVPFYAMRDWLDRGLVEHERTGAWSRLTSAGELEAAKLAEIFRLRKCIQCGGEFAFDGERAAQKLCSPKCKAIRRKVRFATGESRSPWLAVFRELRSQLTDVGREWVTQADAQAISGASSMQMVCLRQAGLITCRPSASKMWRGQPCWEFPVSELKLVKKALRVKNGR